MDGINGTKQLISFSGIIFCLLIFIILVFMQLNEKSKSSFAVRFSEKSISFWFSITFVVVVIFKLAIAYLGPNHIMDISCYASWSRFLAEGGFQEFYANHWCDYPTGYMYILYSLGKLNSILNFDFYANSYFLFLKLPVILSEILAAMICLDLSKCCFSRTESIIMTLLVLINPSNLINTSVWGQIDAVFILFAILTLLSLEKKKYFLAAFLFALLLLIKTQGIFYLPIIGAAYIIMFKQKQRKILSIVHITVSLLICCITYIVFTLPFMHSQGLSLITNNFISSIATYNFVSVMAHNFYTLIGVAENSVDMVPFLFSYKVWGYILISLFSLTSVWLIWKNDKKHVIFMSAGFLLAGIFMFAHGMHERYIASVPVLLLFAYIYLKDNRILISATLYTVFSTINQTSVLFFVNAQAYKIIEIISSCFGVISFIYLLLIIYKILIKNKTPEELRDL